MSVYLITPQLITVYCLKKKWTKNNILPEILNLYLRRPTKNQPNSRNIQNDTLLSISSIEICFLLNFKTFCLLRKIFFSFLDVAERLVASVYLIDPLPVLPEDL